MSESRAPLAAILFAAAICTGASAASADAGQITGRWIMPDNKVLVIRGSNWFHPVNGAATIKPGKGAAEYEVFYTAHQGVRCAYRINATAGGEVLVLDAVDSTQSPDFCPNGRFSRVSR